MKAREGAPRELGVTDFMRSLGYRLSCRGWAVRVGAPRGSGTLIVGEFAYVSSRKQSCFATPVAPPLRWRSRELARTDFVIGYYCRNLCVLKHTPAPSGMLTVVALSCLAFPRMIHRRTSPRLGFTGSFTGQQEENMYDEYEESFISWIVCVNKLV